jgi:hypothetical protein
MRFSGIESLPDKNRDKHRLSELQKNLIFVI